MRSARSRGLAGLCVVAGLGLTGCQTVAAGAEDEAGPQAAVVEATEDGSPATLRLTDEAVGRLGIETEEIGGSGSGLTAPYAAVVYDADGAAWAFVEQEPGVYKREALEISSIDGDTAQLSSGPEPGTPVVIVGAAELVGVEAGISGGE